MLHQAQPLLQINNLSVAFNRYGRGLSRTSLPVISQLSLTLQSGEILAIVGASGSGKSLLAHAILGVLPGNACVSGTILLRGTPVTPANIAALRGREIALIPQSVAYLDPLMQVGRQAVGASPTPAKAASLMQAFGRLHLCEKSTHMYPFQLSGGMARRVLFSTALLDDASVIVADEPTPGMGLAQAKAALAILRELANAQKGVILITHDVDLAVQFADRVAVFHSGTVVEQAEASAFLQGGHGLQHPYTKALWQALPQNSFTAPALPTGTTSVQLNAFTERSAPAASTPAKGAALPNTLGAQGFGPPQAPLPQETGSQPAAPQKAAPVKNGSQRPSATQKTCKSGGRHAT